MGQARIKRLKLQGEIAAKNHDASAEKLAKLVAGHQSNASAGKAEPPGGVTSLMSDVGFITPVQLRINAIHEAGHAVTMTKIGHGVEVTTVDPQEVKHLTGKAMPGFTRPVPKPLTVKDYLCTALAGVMSEATFATNGKISPSEDDFAHVEEILDRADIQGEERNLYRQRNEERTRKLVLEYESEIKRVADALVSQLTLSGEQVRTLIDTAP